MAKYDEATLLRWTKPPSNTEETKLENSQKMVKDAINTDSYLKWQRIKILGQGSYANDTNVRLNSDIDINVMYTEGFYYDLPLHMTEAHFGLDKLPGSNYSFKDFKDDVEYALIKKFGQNEVQRKNKCITIKENTYRTQTDVVPTWRYRRYERDGSYVSGVQFYPDNSGIKTINFPEQHIENGKNKNSLTQKRFKRLTRLHRKLRYKMLDDGIAINDNITSFLLECLVWNVPDYIMNNNETWLERLKQSIIFIYNQIINDASCQKWTEVSGLLYLFDHTRKWSRDDVNKYVTQLYNYLGF